MMGEECGLKCLLLVNFAAKSVPYLGASATFPNRETLVLTKMNADVILLNLL